MRTSVLFLLSLVWVMPSFGAVSYPTKAVRLIVPFAPGGTSDLTGRVISQQLSEQLGKTFVVDNRAGASGTIGNAIVARAAPDGYTLMVADTTLSIIPSLFKSLPFDVTKDFTPITQIIGTPNVLLIHPAVKAHTVKELVSLARTSPGRLNYGSAGIGSITHLSGELFNRSANVNIAHIPFKGGGEAMNAVLGGQVQVLITGISSAITLVEDGRLRALAVTTADKRSVALPSVPSMKEMGLTGMAVYAWYGLMAPAGVSGEIVNRLQAEVVKALAVPAVKERFYGSELSGSTPEEFTRHVRDERRRWADVIKSAGIAPE